MLPSCLRRVSSGLSTKGGCIEGESMTSQAIRGVVVAYGNTLGLEIAPHDLRRTLAKLAHKGGSGLWTRYN